MKHERQCYTKFPNTENRFKNTMRRGVFLKNFGGVWKYD